MDISPCWVFPVSLVVGFLLGRISGTRLAADPSKGIVDELLRIARRTGYTAAEIRRVTTVVDLQGERFHPLLRVFRRRGLTMERSTGLLDQFRLRFLPDGEALPEQVHGFLARDLEARESDRRLDDATRLPGIAQPALPEDNAGENR